MRTVVVVALAAAASLVVPGAQASAAQTCQGKDATIVQAEGVVQGTDGDDVIVGGAATRIRALGGDDTVCVTGGRVKGGDGTDSVEMRGTDAEDFLLLSDVEDVDVETGAGMDHVRLLLNYDLRLAGHMDGGDGEDIVSIYADQTVTINLAQGRLSVGPGQHAALAGFENAAGEAWSIASRIVGDAGDNRLTLVSNYDCGGTVKGGPGDDVISAGRTGVHETCLGIRAYGQAGADVLRGSAYDDILIGGKGRDRAYGGDDEGNDRCSAEVRRGCESR